MSREKGTGSVFYSNQRNQWVACVANGFSPSGGRKYKRMYCKTEAEAKKKLREFLREKDQNRSQTQSTLSVQDYMNKWLETVKRSTMKPSGYDRLELTCVKQVYQIDLRNCIKMLYFHPKLCYNFSKIKISS